MSSQSYSKFFHIGILLLPILMLFGLLPSTQAVLAGSGGGWDENIELTGSFHGTFSLDSNTSQLFRVENAVPGDSWSGDITIQNKTSEPMEVALLTIASEIKDLSLYDALTLDLEIGGDLIYSGTYGETPRQITPYYVVPAGSSIVMTATVAFPSHYGNEMLNKTMDSVWTFEALHQGESSVPAMHPYTVYYIDKETKDSLLPKKVSYAVFDSKVTEHAPNIVGYKPDAEKKSITIQESGNKILFFYEAIDGPSEPSKGASSDPSEPSSEPSTGVKTGNDVSQSNTMPAVYSVLAALCVCSILVTWLRIRAAKRRS